MYLRFTLSMVAILLLVACSPVQDTDAVRVGMLLPLSGELATYGEDVLKGAQLVQRDGLQLIVTDDRGDRKESLSGFRKLRDLNNASVIVGPFGPPSSFAVYGSMQGTDKEALVIGVTLCMDEFSTMTNVVCSYPSMQAQMEKTIAFGKQSGPKGYFVTEQSVLGDTLASLMQSEAQANNVILFIDKLSTTEVDPRIAATKVVQKNPSFVAVALSSPADSFLVIRSIKEQGYTGTIILSSDVNDEQLVQFKEDLEGVYVPWIVGIDDYNEVFVTQFTQRYGARPNIYNALGYELTTAAYELAKQPQQNKETYYSLENSNDYAIKNFHYIHDSVVLPFTAHQIQNGTLVAVE
jgi:ABC-type branched-subunit amino acid transport system substrate-binding protein